MEGSARASLDSLGQVVSQKRKVLRFFWLSASNLLKTLGAYTNVSSSHSETLPHLLDTALCSFSVSQWDSRCSFATFEEITSLFQSLSSWRLELCGSVLGCHCDLCVDFPGRMTTWDNPGCFWQQCQMAEWQQVHQGRVEVCFIPYERKKSCGAIWAEQPCHYCFM